MGRMTRTGKPVWSILDVVHRFHRLASGEDEIGKVPQECSYSIDNFIKTKIKSYPGTCVYVFSGIIGLSISI